MAILSTVRNLLFHIDARRIHGQIIAGWGIRAGVQRFVLADDTVATDEFERQLYLDAAGPDFETLILKVLEAAPCLAAFQDAKRTMLIVSSPRDALRVLDSGLDHDYITLGNLEPGAGKLRLSNAVYVSEDDRIVLAQIIALGVRVMLQSLPQDKPIPVAQLLALHPPGQAITEQSDA